MPFVRIGLAVRLRFMRLTPHALGRPLVRERLQEADQSCL